MTSAYDTIFKRRAVREYNDIVLDDSTLKDIERFISDIKQMGGQEARFEIVTDDEVKGASPYYVLAFCQDNDSAYANVGYVLQKLDLYLQGKGLGSIFLRKKPKKKASDFCVLMSFGNSDVPFRNGEKDFNRLPIMEISNVDNAVARAARLAPSAANSQPWKLTFADNKVNIKYHGRGMMKLFLKKLNMVDIGVATRHVEEALLKEGKTVNSITPIPSSDGLEIEVKFS
jgi:Nitroreductase